MFKMQLSGSSVGIVTANTEYNHALWTMCEKPKNASPSAVQLLEWESAQEIPNSKIYWKTSQINEEFVTQWW